MLDKAPHFSTFGKNYTRRFKDTDLFEQIFSHILSECYKFKLVDPTEVFVDATHVKASTSDPESGWFRKGEHKNVFAYAV